MRTRRQILTLLAALVCLAVLGTLARAETLQKGRVRVIFQGSLSPHALPRRGSAPIAVSIGGRVATTDGTPPPQLRRVQIAINKEGRLDDSGLPRCTLDQIQPSTTAGAQAACGAARVGEGSFSADLLIPERSPFPSHGKLIAFNGAEHGNPVIFAHIYGTDPVRTSYTLTFHITRSRGRFGTLLTASLPGVISNAASITGLSIKLHRRFRAHGHAHSYISAGCPAPRGINLVSFPFVRTTFSFSGAPTIAKTLNRSCRARD